MFGRRTKSAEADATDPERRPAARAGRRPTRKEAEAARKQRLTAPRAAQAERPRSREQAQRAAGQNAHRRCNTGDDRYLPARDKGPVKRYVRDYVDSRRTIGEYLLPVFFVVFIVVVPRRLRRSRCRRAMPGWRSSSLMIGDSRPDRAAVPRPGCGQRFGDDETKGVDDVRGHAGLADAAAAAARSRRFEHGDPI